MNNFFDSTLNRNIVTIYPGEFYVSKGPEFISTILGSCVAICLYDSQNLIGGMNHFMLAKDNSNPASEAKGPAGRFGVYAVELLLNEMILKGADRKNLSAKIFGGGNVLNIGDTSLKQVGNENIEFARKILEKEKIPVVAEDVGGINSRKIILDPATFKVLLKRINSGEQ